MSTYEVRSVTITPSNAHLQAVVSEFLTADGSWISSSSMEKLACPMPAGSPVASLARRWDAVSQVDGAVSMLTRVNPAGVEEARRLTSAARDADRLGHQGEAGALARRAETSLASALHDGIGLARRRERQVVASTAAASLEGLGYRITLREGQSTTGLLAERGHHVLAVRVGDGGVMELDVAGLAGGECAAPVREFHQELRRRGIESVVVHRNDHGDDRGGSLIHRAAARNRRDLAFGVVLDAEAPQAGRKPSPIVQTSRQGVAQ